MLFAPLVTPQPATPPVHDDFFARPEVEVREGDVRAPPCDIETGHLLLTPVEQPRLAAGLTRPVAYGSGCGVLASVVTMSGMAPVLIPLHVVAPIAVPIAIVSAGVAVGVATGFFVVDVLTLLIQGKQIAEAAVDVVCDPAVQTGSALGATAAIAAASLFATSLPAAAALVTTGAVGGAVCAYLLRHASTRQKIAFLLVSATATAAATYRGYEEVCSSHPSTNLGQLCKGVHHD